MSFFDNLEQFANEVEKFFRGKPEALKLKSCKKCSFYKRGYCTQTSPPTRILSEYYAQGCINYTTSLPIVGVNIKNMWQDAENLDAVHGYTSYIWIPDETLEIKLLKLHVYAEKFRAYSKGAASGGYSVPTTSSGGYSVETSTGGGGGHIHKIFAYYADGGEEALRIFYGVKLDAQSVGVVFTCAEAVDLYSWSTDINHAHDVTIPNHTHTVTIPNHTHPIEYGIYEEAIAGRTLSAKLYDPDDVLLKDFGVIITGEDDLILDLSDYFETLQYGMFRLELTASSRLRARLIYYELCAMSAVS